MEENDEWKPCKLENNKFYPCRSMDVLLNSTNVSGVGAHICHIINFNNLQEKDLGVYYQFSKKASENSKYKLKKLMFNVCPFCKADILDKNR